MLLTALCFNMVTSVGGNQRQSQLDFDTGAVTDLQLANTSESISETEGT